MSRNFFPRLAGLSAWLIALVLPAIAQAQVTATFGVAPVEADAAPADDEKSADKKADKKDAGKDDSMFKDKAPGSDDERGAFEMHHWGVWMADPANDRINARELFLTSMPTGVETTRPRKMKDDKKPPAPTNVVTFYGEGAGALDVDLRVKGGAPLAHWPPAQIKSARLHWPEYQLATTAPDDAAWLRVPDEHWFSTVRQTDALMLRKGARAERLLTYDFEAAFPVPLKIEGGPDKYQLRSTAAYALHDLVIVTPDESGRRIGWLDLLPAAPEAKPNEPNQNNAAANPNAAQPGQPGQPAQAAAVLGLARPAAAPVAVVNGVAQNGPSGQPNQPQANQPNAAPGTRPPGPPVTVTMSDRLPAGSEPWTAQSTTALTDRLAKTGLNRKQIDLLVSLYGPVIFGGDALVVAWRIPPSVVDEVTPLVAEPEPSKTVRVVLVVARNMDPVIEQTMQALVDQLGNPAYKTREAAEEKLKELGSLAVPALRKSMKSTDPEIAFRTERLLQAQKENFDQQNQAEDN